ncbi:hypothetical protein [Streptomyces finlayi]|uniref:hypothetical protein n=1 Tax=Streptomyces finlayi TaxID=67296 RepID=UPI00215608E5|nr:hypothetical protein [Streptomyces finlayi]
MSEKVTETVGTAKEQAAGVAGEASAKAQDLVGQLRDQLQDQARSQTQNMARNVRRLSDELSDMSENAEDGSAAAAAVKNLADRGRRVATHLESKGPEGLVGDLQEFARRRPGAFLAGAALAGFAAARLGKGAKSAGESGPQISEGTETARTGDSGSGGHERRTPDGERRADAPGPPYAYDTADSGDGYGSPPVTPSYGGSVAAPGPGPVSQSDPNPYPDPDPGPRQP